MPWSAVSMGVPRGSSALTGCACVELYWGRTFRSCASDAVRDDQLIGGRRRATLGGVLEGQLLDQHGMGGARRLRGPETVFRPGRFSHRRPPCSGGATTVGEIAAPSGEARSDQASCDTFFHLFGGWGGRRRECHLAPVARHWSFRMLWRGLGTDEGLRVFHPTEWSWGNSPAQRPPCWSAGAADSAGRGRSRRSARLGVRQTLRKEAFCSSVASHPPAATCRRPAWYSTAEGVITGSSPKRMLPLEHHAVGQELRVPPW